MLKRVYFGWYAGKTKEEGKEYKCILLGIPSDEWHGYRVDRKYFDTSLVVPAFQPGEFIGVDFNEFGRPEAFYQLKDNG